MGITFYRVMWIAFTRRAHTSSELRYGAALSKSPFSLPRRSQVWLCLRFWLLLSPCRATSCVRDIRQLSAAIVAALLLAGCSSSDTAGYHYSAPAGPAIDLGRGCRVAIVAEAGSDSEPIVQKLYELFTAAGRYQLVDRTNLRQTMEERDFQRMSFVEKRPTDSLRGVDVFVYVQADGNSSQAVPNNDVLASLFGGHTIQTSVGYVASYRVVRMATGEVVSARRIDLSDAKGNFTFGGFAGQSEEQAMLAAMRSQAAGQIFQALHP